MRSQQPGVPQPWLRQQSGVNDVQLRQQHFMYKHIQELQRQQQLQQLDQEARQQNSLSPLSAIAKQTSSDHLHPFLNGAPVHDASNFMWPGQPMGGDPRIPSTSQMLVAGNTDWAQRNGTPTMQGFQNGLMFPQEQSQVFRSMGFVPQQLDQSLYGAPVATGRGMLNQYPHFQGISNDGADTLTKASGNQVNKPIMQSAAFNAFQSDQSAEFPSQGCMADDVSVSSQGFQGKNSFEHVPVQTLHNGILAENFQHVSSLSRNAQVQEFHDRQERVSWDGNLQEKAAAQVGPSQGTVSLDPTEAKILFDSDDGIWDSSFGRIGGIPGNQLEGTDYSNAFPTVQSGSWSALMQSAVAEAPSSDTGLQDEWSGLNFQKTELSTDNRAVSLNDSGKQPTAWVDNNLQTGSSLTSRPFPLFSDANISQSGHGVPSFQQNASRESLQPLPKDTGKWFDQSPQQKPLFDGTFQVQAPMHMDSTQEGTWGHEIYEQSRSSAQSADMELNSQNMQGSWARQQNTISYNIGNQSCNKPDSWNINKSLSPNEDGSLKMLDNENATQLAQSNESRGDIHIARDHDSRLRKKDDDIVATSFPNATSGFEQVQSGASSPQVRTDPYLNNFSVLRNSSTSKINQEMTGQVQHSHQLDYGKHVIFDSSIYRNNETVGKHQHRQSQGTEVCESSLNTSERGSGETYDKKHETYSQKGISERFMSGHSHPYQPNVGDGMRGNAWSVAADARPLFSGNQKSAGQVGRKTSASRKFQYHPMGNLGVGLDSSDASNYVTHSQALSHLPTQGFQEQGYIGQSKSVGHVVLNSCMDTEKDQLPDMQRNLKGVEEMPSRSAHPGYESAVSTSFDGPMTFSTQNRRTNQTNENMLELLHKVDQSRENNTVVDVGSSDNNQQETSEATALDRSIAHLHQSQSSGSQGFGLRLGPPSQRSSSSNHAMPSQTSSQITDDLNSRHMDQEGSGKVMLGIPFPRSRVQQQHFSSSSGQVVDQARNPFTSQADTDAHKLPSHFRLNRDSHDGAPQLSQASFPAAATRILPFNVVSPADARGHIPSPQSYTSGSAHSQPMNANASYLRGSGQQPLVSKLPPTPAMSHGGFSSMLQNVWTNVTSQQHLSGGLSNKVPSGLLQPMHPSANSLEAASWVSRNVDDQGVNKEGNVPSDFGTGSINLQQPPYGEEQHSKDSLQQMQHERINPAAETSGSFHERDPVFHPRQDDLGRGMPGREQSIVSQSERVFLQNVNSSNNVTESFGRSLRSSGDSHQEYSLLHQMQAMKGTDADSSRSFKRLKGADFGADTQDTLVKTAQRFAHGPSTMVRDPVQNELSASAQHIKLPSPSSNMLCFSSEGKETQNANASHPYVADPPSKDVVRFGQNDLQNHSVPLGTSILSSRGHEHSRINPQMAPSWFERYGTFKNGQILAMHNGLDISRRDAKMAAQQFLFGKASEGLPSHTVMEQATANAGNASQGGNIWQSAMDTVPAGEHLSSSLSLPPPIDQNLVVLGAKKRKSATSGLLPWHKEVTLGSQRLQNISVAELDWAQATNRLVEKVEDEVEMTEDGPLMPRPRRRLILTTQLMQQLLRSLPAAIMSADASSEFEGVAYLTAKFALGDACSLISFSGSDSCVQPHSRSMISGKAKASKGARDQCFSKLVEDFINRARKLENDLLRLDKRASILDIRVECQELEKISVINRFARFHGRGNAEGVESSSSTEATPQKPYPQRYVTALPLPRNLPDGVPCLSL